MSDQIVTITLDVNGERRAIALPSHHTLLEALREELGLTGTKHGCELGECGAWWDSTMQNGPSWLRTRKSSACSVSRCVTYPGSSFTSRCFHQSSSSPTSRCER